METRAPCIASVSAVGTATGGISGPLPVDDTEDGDDDSDSEGSSGGRSPAPTSI